MFILDEDQKLNKPSEIMNVLQFIKEYKNVKKKENIRYYNFPVAFDIESSSVQLNGQKAAFMYEWSFCLDGKVIIGREWKEFLDMLEVIKDYYELNNYRRLIIYVHNLAYEFQFIRKLFKWQKVFSLSKRKPIQAITIDGIEFRCSYLLSGYSLAKLSDQLIKYKVSKKVGDLDYSLIRHSKTELTKQELKYCSNDVIVVCAYIQELIERLGDITKIPLTKTGFVRKYTRDTCLYEGGHAKKVSKFNNYRKLIKNLTLNVETYRICKEAFMGGFTHANPVRAFQVTENVDSFDLISDYPSIMVSEKFPMSRPEKVIIKSEEEFQFNLRNYCCIFTIEINGLKPIVYFENYISSSHCKKLVNPLENNGRLVSADHLITTITEQDFRIIEAMYKWDDMGIINFYRFKKGFLPKEIVLSVLKLYENKTKLKGVEGYEVEYMRSKEDLNSEFGMCVTDICRDNITYKNNEWGKELADIEEEIGKYNKSVKRFLYYPWGIYITAYARRNLFTAIFEFQYDYIYSDTDSVKVVNADKHMEYIDKFNSMIINKIKRVLNFYNIDVELMRPKNKKGEVRQLGIWDWEKEKNEEHSYKNFKTLGAKRYMVEFYNERRLSDSVKSKYSLTVSGLRKFTAIPYMEKKYKNIFDAFSEDLTIPPEYSGRTTHTYIDEEVEGYVKDYKGNYGYFNELSSVHIENSEYSLSLSDKYIDYLLNIAEMEVPN